MKKLVSIVACMYNEQDVAQLFCETVLGVMHGIGDKYDTELILVDDGSGDATYEKMTGLHEKYPDEISVIRLTRNFGLEPAINCGLKNASGDCVIVMDADMQDPPALIPEMLNAWENGADVVNARRKSREVDSAAYKFCAGWYYKFLIMFSGKMHVEKNSSVYRLLSRKAVDAMTSLTEINTEFRVLIPFVGMKNAVVYYNREQRGSGKSKFNFSSRYDHLINSITSISTKPLRLISLLIPVIMALFIACFIAMLIVNEPVWKSALFTACVASFCTGVLLFSGCIIAEYVAQIFKETKGRPAYLISDEIKCSNAVRADRNSNRKE